MSLFVNGFKHFLKNSLKNNVKMLIRNSYPVRCASAYECDGKTTICILNKEYEHGIFLDSFGNTGFRLNNGVSIIGPLVIFQRSVLSWNVAGPDDITKESFSLFTVLDPKIDLLVIGLGDMDSFTSFNNRVKRMAMELGINCETLPTESACSTYNFLVSEGSCLGLGCNHIRGVCVRKTCQRTPQELCQMVLWACYEPKKFELFYCLVGRPPRTAVKAIKPFAYGRCIGAALNAAACLIPPVTIKLMDDDVVRSNSRYNYPFMTVGDDASSKD